MSDTTAQTSSDPAGLSLTGLRALRQQLQHEDDVVSYARRVAQARLDLVKSELSRRDAGPDSRSPCRPRDHERKAHTTA